MKTFSYLAVLFLMVAALTACSKKETVTAPAPKANQDASEAITKLFMDMERMIRSGETNKALQSMEAAIADPKYIIAKPDIFRSIIQIQLVMKDVEGAKKEYLKVMKADPDLSECAFGQIESYYISFTETDKTPELIDWIKTMLDQHPSRRVKTASFVQLFNAYLRQNDFNNIMPLVAEAETRFGKETASLIYQEMVQSLKDNANYDNALSVIDKIESLATPKPDIENILASARVTLLCKQKKWQEAENVIRNKIKILTPDILTESVGALVAGAYNDNKKDVAGNICDFLIQNRDPNEQATVYCAINTINNLCNKDDYKTIPGRIRKLNQAKMADTTIYYLTLRPFYFTGEIKDIETLKDYVAIFKELLASADNDKEKSNISLTMMDGYFLMNDLQSVISLIENKIPEKDEAWHEKILIKVKAHKALADGNKEEAVKDFQRFMEIIANSDEKEFDPSTGMSYSKNWLLGRNNERIGDILISMKKKSEAKASYESAKEYYTKAISDYDSASKEAESIRKTLSELGNKAN